MLIHISLKSTEHALGTMLCTTFNIDFNRSTITKQLKHGWTIYGTEQAHPDSKCVTMTMTSTRHSLYFRVVRAHCIFVEGFVFASFEGVTSKHTKDSSESRIPQTSTHEDGNGTALRQAHGESC